MVRVPKTDKVKKLLKKYFLLSPTDISTKQAVLQNLIPYQEFVQINDPDILIRGPFDFATLNGKQNRDRINRTLWDILRSRHVKYDDSPPQVRNNSATIDFDAPYVMAKKSHEILSRVTSFLEQLETNDSSLKEYNN